MSIVTNEIKGFMSFSKFEEAFKWAQMISRSSLCPVMYKGKPEDILIAAQIGIEVGLKPMQAIKNIMSVRGVWCMWGDALLALCMPQIEYHSEWFDKNEQIAHCVYKRKGRPEVKIEFTKEQAEKANLLGKSGPWNEYPDRMYIMKARGLILRNNYADLLCGLITREEAEDYNDIPSVTQIRREKIIKPAYVKPEPKEIEDSEGRVLLQLEPLIELESLMAHLEVSEKEIDAWNKRAQVENYKDIPEDKIVGLIEMLKKRLDKDSV